MVSQKRYMPTNKRFQDHTKMFVGTKTKKGHLNGKEEEKDKTLVEGTLVRIIKQKIYEEGWEVKVGKDSNAKTYMCSYGDNIMYLPDCTETEMYYVPKQECSVQVSIDENTKMYFIMKINDPTKQPISIMNDNISIQSNGTGGLEITSDMVQTTGELSSDTDVTVKTNDVQISLKEVGEQVDDLKKNGLETKGDVVVSTEKSTVSLIETNDKIDSIYKNGVGNLQVNNQISISQLYNKVIDLENRIEQLERNNG